MLAAAIVFGYLGYAFWFIFKVDMNIKMIAGYEVSGVQELRFAVELVNKGKATSLRSWTAYFIEPDGRTFKGLPENLEGDRIVVDSADHKRNLYALPDCDLQMQTVRSLQTGDAYYGVLAAQFPGFKKDEHLMEVKVELKAKGMLGRTISSGKIPFHLINQEARETFPCRLASAKPQ